VWAHPGATMNDGRQHFIAHLDHIRRLLMNQPRGIRRCRARSCSRRHDPTVTTASSTYDIGERSLTVLWSRDAWPAAAVTIAALIPTWSKGVPLPLFGDPQNPLWPQQPDHAGHGHLILACENFFTDID